MSAGPFFDFLKGLILALALLTLALIILHLFLQRGKVDAGEG